MFADRYGSRRRPDFILSERSDESAALCAFDLGVDDFIRKPFSAREVFARVKVFLYRTGSTAKNMPSKSNIAACLSTRSPEK